jgi:hypothetical protein
MNKLVLLNLLGYLPARKRSGEHVTAMRMQPQA